MIPGSLGAGEGALVREASRDLLRGLVALVFRLRRRVEGVEKVAANVQPALVLWRYRTFGKEMREGDGAK